VYGVELPDLLDVKLAAEPKQEEDQAARARYLRARRLYRSLVTNLPYRDSQAISQRTIDLLNDAQRHLSREEFYQVLFLLAPQPDNRLNGAGLHRYLLRRTMPQRDSDFGFATYHQLSDGFSPAARLARWAAAGPYPAYDAEVVKLACIPLCWLLSSPNRFMRDWVTKALVQLLRGHLDVMRALFERFWTVDDPYVVQRMVAIAYGALLRSTPTQADQAKALAEAVHAKIFARPVRADELLLDAARGITRWAVAHQFLPDSALDSARRPYGLKPPAAPPTKETIEAKYGWRQGQPDDESYSAIDSSVLGMGDFGRYVIASGLHDFSRYRIGQEYPERGDRQPRLVKKRWNEFVSSLSDKQKAALADQLRDPVQHELSSLSFMMRREKDPLSKRQRALYEAAFVYPKPVNDGYPAARSPPAAHPLMLRLVNKNAASRFRCTGKLCRAGQSGGSERLYSWGMSQGGLALLLRLNKSWRDGISAEDLYEITRAWWVISPANAQRVERVLAVAGGVVREVYRPTRWLPSPIEGLENRIGFEDVVAPDRENYVGRDVSRLFRHGSANPVRYLPLDALLEQAVITPDPVSKTPLARAEEIPSGAVEPGLLERVLPLLDAFEKDLLWAQSRAGQELFHSNTIAWLLRNFPIPCAPLLDLLGATRYDGVSRVDVWRERRHLDIVIDPVGASPKVVIENKLYSVPYPAQLTQYNAYSLPWSADHGDGGARATRYVLLSLMAPSFPLPAPWTHVDYRDLAGALDQIDAAALGRTSDQLIRYRALIHRLVALAEAVDPAQALDEPFPRPMSSRNCRAGDSTGPSHACDSAASPR